MKEIKSADSELLLNLTLGRASKRCVFLMLSPILNVRSLGVESSRSSKLVRIHDGREPGLIQGPIFRLLIR